MDAKDLFKQLTCGVNFAATKTNRKRSQPPIAQPSVVKKEKLEAADSDDDDDAFDDDAFDDASFRASHDEDDIKSEAEEADDSAAAAVDDDDRRNDLNLFGSIVAPNLTAKKKKQPPTEGKLKQLEVQRVRSNLRSGALCGKEFI